MSGTPFDKQLLMRANIPQVLHAYVDQWFQDTWGGQAGQSRPRPVSDDDWTTFVRLIACSEFAANTIARAPDWFVGSLESGSIAVRSNLDDLAACMSDMLASNSNSNSNTEHAKSVLRRMRDQQLTRILWRSIAGQDDVDQTLVSLSELADLLISTGVQFAEKQMSARFGKPVNAHGATVSLVTLAMGKLGGYELNFSSDIDLIFLYTEDGETNGPRTLSAHEYFVRLSRQIVALLDEVTEDGFVYRVDTRLRPFGDSGPPVVSFAALENYLLQHGRSWERYAYIKARPIADDSTKCAVTELQTNVIEPFVYRRYLDFGVFESLRDMKSLIAAEVEKKELRNNIKLGPGGIREIEFITQALQLVRGGADAKLRCRELKQALLQFDGAKYLGAAAVTSLLKSYNFLRNIENGIQAIRDQQTHDIPTDPADQARLLVWMQRSSWSDFVKEMDRCRGQVSDQFAKVAFRGDERGAETELSSQLESHWNKFASLEDWDRLLKSFHFDESLALATVVSHFSASVQQQVDVTAQKRLARFIRTVLLSMQERHRASVVCERVLAVASQIVRRSAYVALLNENPGALDRLINLCDQSAYLASEIARFPLLLDELLDPRLYSAEISAATMTEDLADRLEISNTDDSETVMEILAQFQRAMLFRIAVADVSGNLPIMKVSDRLTDLAEIVVSKTLEIAWTDLTRRHGVPLVEGESGTFAAGFGVIGYGKLGGIEMSYQSDLDLVFLHDSIGDGQQTTGPKVLENSMFFGRLVRRVVHFLTAQTGSGRLYEVDTRLRPSGRSGLLVVSTDGFARYQEENAWTWEHQALLRSRPIAGSAKVGREFERIRTETLCNLIHAADLRSDVYGMRQKMRKQLDQSNTHSFDLKQGQGGIGDIEFLVQYLVLANAHAAPALIHYTDNIRQLGTLEAVGVLCPDEATRLQDVYRAFRLRVHRLALDGHEPLIPLQEFTNEHAFVSKIWRREMLNTDSSDH